MTRKKNTWTLLAANLLVYFTLALAATPKPLLASEDGGCTGEIINSWTDNQCDPGSCAFGENWDYRWVQYNTFCWDSWRTIYHGCC